jgi:hypothetical protein
MITFVSDRRFEMLLVSLSQISTQPERRSEQAICSHEQEKESEEPTSCANCGKSEEEADKLNR